MSKKSRRRNRKILGALALLGTGLALANRGKGTEMSNISVDSGRGSGLRPTVDDKGSQEFKEKVYKDAIMRGGVGVKAAKQPLRFGQVIDKEGKTKTLKPFESAGLTLGVRKTDTTPTQKAVNLANKQMAKGMLPPQLRAPGRTNITTQQGKNREAIRNFFKPSEDSKDFGLGMYDMKDGGRVTKRKGAAKRGFGKAFKGGK